MFVERKNGKIVGVYAVRQPGKADESVADASSELADFSVRVGRHEKIIALEGKQARALREAVLFLLSQIAGTAPPAAAVLADADTQIAALRLAIKADAGVP
jgi:hypothetical protein